MSNPTIQFNVAAFRFLVGVRARIALAVAVLTVSSLSPAGTMRFAFGTNAARADAIQVPRTDPYAAERGFGFEWAPSLRMGPAFVVSDEPFAFSLRLPEGNYAVTVSLGGAGDTAVTVKAEARRLMLERVTVPARETVTRTFVVNLRRPEFGSDRVRLKQRELDTETITWDDRLTLEFLGRPAALRALEVAPTNVPTIYLCGDSTVCDQPREPWNSWGQMLPRFFGPGVAVANYAQSGESLKSSLAARRFDKVFSLLKTNDWLLVQFGHNDMKDRATNALAAYRANLKQIVARTRGLGATPVLITSMERKSGVERETLAGYPATMREVAREDAVALIDLQAMSQVLYRALGPNLDHAFQDGTHHNNYGSYELARCVVRGFRANKLDLVRYLTDDAGEFDPAQPDAPDGFQLPASAGDSNRTPEGD